MSIPEHSRLTDLEALVKIYRLYDHYLDGFFFACRKQCSECCTTSVTITRLEGRLIHDFLDGQKKGGILYQHIRECARTLRYQPALTTNGYARMCVQGKTPPPEILPEQPEPCPLLENDLCAIYPVRPFGCRCMNSSLPCPQTGSAHIDELTLTVNTVFLQAIEHLDQSGFFGNLTDVLLCVNSDAGQRPPECITMPNQPVAQLMVPPEHQKKIQPLLDTLNHILSRTIRE